MKIQPPWEKYTNPVVWRKSVRLAKNNIKGVQVFSFYILFCFVNNMSENISSAAAASVGVASIKRDFIRVDLSDFEIRKDEIVKTIMEAATTQGFFYGKY